MFHQAHVENLALKQWIEPVEQATVVSDPPRRERCNDGILTHVWLAQRPLRRILQVVSAVVVAA